MCQRITCRQCGKPTFAGCGRHVESVLGDVPPAKRCPGHSSREDASTGQGGSSSPLGRFLDFLSGGREGKRS
jgi:hypothetical protein